MDQRQKRQKSIVRRLASGCPSVLRLSFRGKPSLLSLLIRNRGRQWRNVKRVLWSGERGDEGLVLFEGRPSLAQVLCGYYLPCKGDKKSIAQLVLQPHGKNRRSVLDLLIETLVELGLFHLLFQDSNGPSLLSMLLENEGENVEENPSLLRLLVSDRLSPPLLAFVAEKNVLPILFSGEDSNQNSLFRIGVLQSTPGKSFYHFFLAGEAQGKPSLVRLMVDLYDQHEGDTWLLLSNEFIEKAIARLRRADSRLHLIAGPLQDWINDNDVLNSSFVDILTLGIQVGCEILYEIIFNTYPVDVQVALLGNETTVEPLYHVFLEKDENGLFRMPILFVLGTLAGLRSNKKGPVQTGEMLKWWQGQVIERAKLLDKTCHANSSWVRTLSAIVSNVSPGGNWEQSFFDVARGMGGRDESKNASLSIKERILLIINALFEERFEAKWTKHWENVLAVTEKEEFIPIWNDLRDRSWEKVVDHFLADQNDLSTTFLDIETFLVEIFENLISKA